MDDTRFLKIAYHRRPIEKEDFEKPERRWWDQFWVSERVLEAQSLSVEEKKKNNIPSQYYITGDIHKLHNFDSSTKVGLLA
jgi:hypothetical protein